MSAVRSDRVGDRRQSADRDPAPGARRRGRSAGPAGVTRGGSLHVLHIGKFYPPEYRGGLESVVVSLNRELVRRGVEVSCVVAAVHGASRNQVVAGVRVQRVRSLGTLWSQPLAPGLVGAARRTAADLVHLHHPHPLGDVAALATRGRPLVVTHHSDVVRQRALWPVYGPLVRRTLAAARRVAVGSEQLLAQSGELRGFEHKVRVIPFGIDPGRFDAMSAADERVVELRRRWGGRPVVLAVGRLVPYKGFNVLVRAAAALEASVVVVGTGPEWSRLRAAAGPNVVFMGNTTDEELVACYRAADVFCLPSVSVAEAFGMVLLEAMACGLPLVTTALPTGVSAVNRDGVTGLVVPPGDSEALREVLSGLLADSGRRAAMGAAARRTLDLEYSAAVMTERYLTLYREALA